MKIFCILEKGTAADGAPANWYVLSDSMLLRTDNPFFVPDFDTEFRAFPALAVRIDRLGKSIAPRFAHRYYAEAAIAATVRATSLLHTLAAQGLPWDRAVSFDKSCFVGNFLPLSQLAAENPQLHCADSSLSLNCAPLCQQIDNTIAAVSRDNTLKTGDLILLPFPGISFEMIPGTNLKVEFDSRNILEIRIK